MSESGDGKCLSAVWSGRIIKQKENSISVIRRMMTLRSKPQGASSFFKEDGQMEQVRYMISDAANIVQLEQHVLRYWEDELQLDIPRNEMGHRYYTDDNIKEFLKIKELKEKGYQLKAIRMYLKNEKQREQRNKERERQVLTITNARELGLKENEETEPQTTVVEDPKIRMEQFQAVMTEIVTAALKNNNGALAGEVGDRILKEMNYLMREQQEQEEERYRKLDAAIRGQKEKIKKAGKKRGLFGGKSRQKRDLIP